MNRVMVCAVWGLLLAFAIAVIGWSVNLWAHLGWQGWWL